MGFRYLIYLTGITILWGCTQGNNKPVARVNTLAAKPALAEPFKFHKMLEVTPGNYYDVFSWGRGTKDGGQYMILRSDSADQQYNAINGNLEGPIKDVLNADLDTDGNPEIIIYAQSIDTNRYINVFVYEYLSDEAHKIDFPRLTTSQRNGYRGGDIFYIKESKLIREFPIYEGLGSASKLRGQKRALEYSLHSNTFSVKKISKDSTVNKPDQLSTQSHQSNAVKKSKGTKISHKNTASGKKHTPTVKKRRKHRR